MSHNYLFCLDTQRRGCVFFALLDGTPGLMLGGLSRGGGVGGGSEGGQE